MKKIELAGRKGKGVFMLVDDEDFESLSKVSWNFNKPRENVYAKHNKHGMVHRFIMKAPKGMFVDHINFNTLDNQKSNLRVCTPAQNNYHTKERWDTKIRKKRNKYRGVFVTKNGKFVVQVQKDEKKYHFGTHSNEVEAAKVYDKAVKVLHGEFAVTNFKV